MELRPVLEAHYGRAEAERMIREALAEIMRRVRDAR